MNIFLCGSFVEEHLTAWSVLRALKELGHNVLIFDYRQHFLFERKANSFLNFLLLLDKFNPDLVLILKGELFNSSMLTAMSNYRVALWHFDFDDAARIQLEYQSPHLDYVFTICKPWHVKFPGRKGGYWLPQGNDPVMFYPVLPDKDALDDIIYVGTYNYSREKFLAKFIKAGFKVAIYGENWHVSFLKKFWRRAVYCRDFSQAVANSKIVINSGVCRTSAVYESTLSQRIFRVCGSKGVYLTNSIDGISDFYAPWKEIFTYQDITDALEIARLLCDNFFQRRAASCGAYRRTMAEHLYIHRLRRLIACVS